MGFQLPFPQLMFMLENPEASSWYFFPISTLRNCCFGWSSGLVSRNSRLVPPPGKLDEWIYIYIITQKNDQENEGKWSVNVWLQIFRCPKYMTFCGVGGLILVTLLQLLALAMGKCKFQGRSRLQPPKPSRSCAFLRRVASWTTQ